LGLGEIASQAPKLGGRMAKKKPEEKPEITSLEAQAPVSVEMTASQAEEFAEIQAKKEAKDEYNPKEPYRIQLAYSHNINGKKYGPGEAIVPHELVGRLQVAENQNLTNELKLNQSTNRFFEVTGRGAARPVRSLPGV
jgi:hypothetical protein